MAWIVSADDLFTQPDGRYTFDPKFLPLAHQRCFREFLHHLQHNPEVSRVVIMSGIPGSGKSYHAMRRPTDALVVDNTNLNAWEISPYVLAAEARGLPVAIIRVACAPTLAFERQRHGVSAEAHARMAQAFAKRDVLPWWNVIEVGTAHEMGV